MKFYQQVSNNGKNSSLIITELVWETNEDLAFDKSTEHKDKIETLQKDKDNMAKKVGKLTLDRDFAVEKLQWKFHKYPYLLKDFRDYAGRVVTEIFNTDQGSQYTSKEHTIILQKHGIKISMDGVGRATDNIAIERFWRSIKYEEIYLNEYKNIKALNRAIEKYMNSYKQRRLHSAIGYKTPNEVYYQADNNLDAKGVKPLPLVS